ncbi:MAG: DUF4013 domain-containing protein [Anaerolineales bacterium]|nr:DUF4013 domain-containing protein [Anaerolineales bacterium]
MNLQEAIRFPFRRDGWPSRIAIGGALYLVPFVGIFFLAGYMVELMRRITQGNPDPMPDWDNWGEKFKEGALAIALLLVWMLIFMVPLTIVSLIFSAISSDFGQVMGFLFGIIGGIILMMLMPAFLGRFAATGSFKSGLQFPIILRLLIDHAGEYFGQCLLAVLFMLLALIILWIAGALVCGIGLIFTQFFWNLFQSFLMGKLYMILARDVQFSDS